jgi:hypothetical protein
MFGFEIVPDKKEECGKEKPRQVIFPAGIKPDLAIKGINKRQ